MPALARSLEPVLGDQAPGSRRIMETLRSPGSPGEQNMGVAPKGLGMGLRRVGGLLLTTPVPVPLDVKEQKLPDHISIWDLLLGCLNQSHLKQMFNLCMSFLILDSEIDAKNLDITSPLFILVVAAALFCIFGHKV